MLEDRSYGAIVIFENKFLVLKHKRDFWGFPKGHKEGNESLKETVLRELKEETGISNCRFLNGPLISEEYTFVWEDGKEYHKIVEYLIGVTEDNSVVLQEDEVVDYKWSTYTEALEILTYDNTKETLKQAKESIDKLNMVK